MAGWLRGWNGKHEHVRAWHSMACCLHGMWPYAGALSMVHGRQQCRVCACVCFFSLVETAQNNKQPFFLSCPVFHRIHHSSFFFFVLSFFHLFLSTYTISHTYTVSPLPPLSSYHIILLPHRRLAPTLSFSVGVRTRAIACPLLNVNLASPLSYSCAVEVPS